jgi:hypothetical protein
MASDDYDRMCPNDMFHSEWLAQERERMKREAEERKKLNTPKQ